MTVLDPGLALLLEAPQYSVPDSDKQSVLVPGLDRLSAHHRDRSLEYARMMNAARAPVGSNQLADVPYLPVSLFKSLELRSVPQDQVFKVMTSSGTTSQVPSRVYLDVETARLQTRALSSIVTHYVGPKGLPMLIVDNPDVIHDRRQFSARGAGILGMLSFGRDHLYVLDERMGLDRRALDVWLARHAGESVLVFGFTYMIWRDFLLPLRGAGIDLTHATLIHSGGWKKLTDMAVTNAIFKRELREAFGLERVHDFYGMVEQVGSIFFECPAGYFHPPNFADIVVRDPRTWLQAPDGATGVAEVVSLLPRSYPGHALLTEDIAVVHGVDDCACGRMGRWFEVTGRVPKAEIRGCSDTQVRT